MGDMWFGVACDGEKVYATTFASNKENVLTNLKESVSSEALLAKSEPCELAERVLSTLKDVYDGKDVKVDFPFAWKYLSRYAERIIKTVCMIPVGYVSSYGAVAKAAGGSPRAVGRVMATNPFPPVCPCHRVISSDCTLGGYGGGLALKLAFLKREKRGYASEREIAIGTKKLRVFPVEFVLKKAEKGQALI